MIDRVTLPVSTRPLTLRLTTAWTERLLFNLVCHTRQGLEERRQFCSARCFVCASSKGVLHEHCSRAIVEQDN